jgi:hypothetical protein
LHQNVGFLLQYRGEVSSNQGVSVETSELMSLIDVHLKNAGFEGVEKDELVSRIVGITNQRLVFLTNKNDNEWSFEVRSLQEYMAAERLLSRADAQIIEDRLRSIALSSYWRNVFLFAVGKSFNQVDRLDLCDKIFSICFDLGATDTKEIIYSWHGQELALEILMSGAVNTNPNFTKKFYSISLGLLDLPNPESMGSEFFNILGSDKIDRIVSLSSKQQCSQIVLTKIRSRLESDDPKSISIASWEILVSLVHLNIGEAIELANRKWPTDAESQFLILRFFPMFKETQWLKRKLQEFIPHAKIKHINYFQNSGFVLVVDDSFPARELFRNRSLRPETKIKIVGQATNYISYTSLGAESTRKVVASIKGLGSVSCELDIYNVAASFISEPNRQSLCDILNFAADNDLFGLRFQLPWVVHDCIRHATSSLDLRSFADIARDGGFGDQEQWLQAERRWDSNGIAIDDLFYATEGDMPYDRNIGSIGFPRYHNLHAEWKGMINFPFAVVDILPRITDRRNRSVAFNWLMFFGSFLNKSDLTEYITPDVLKDMLLSMSSVVEVNWELGPTGISRNGSEWLQFLDWLGKQDNFVFSKFDDQWISLLVGAYKSDPLRLGLLYHFISICKYRGFPSFDFVPNEILEDYSGNEFRVMLSLLMISLERFSGGSTEGYCLVDRILPVLAACSIQIDRRDLLHSFEKMILRVPNSAEFLIRFYELVRETDPEAALFCISLFRKIIASHPSNLHTVGMLDRLKLPALPI